MASITLRVLDGADRGRAFEEMNTPVTIGREDGNSVQLNDERVSRFHLKIQDDQDKVVLTDLESTNGTKVNGEDIQLRILRVGDMISVGRSVLLFGSKDEIEQHLATRRSAGQGKGSGTIGHDQAAYSLQANSLEFDMNWSDDDSRSTFHPVEPPDLPERLSPGQAAQLCEVLDYLHVRIRDLLASVRADVNGKRISLDERRWQSLLELQAQLAIYLRSIGDPPSD